MIIRKPSDAPIEPVIDVAIDSVVATKIENQSAHENANIGRQNASGAARDRDLDESSDRRVASTVDSIASGAMSDALTRKRRNCCDGRHKAPGGLFYA